MQPSEHRAPSVLAGGMHSQARACRCMKLTVKVVARFLELNKLVRQIAAHVLHEQYSTCLCTIVLLVVA